VPGDISSAAFFIVAACIKPGSHIVLEDIGINPTRSAVIEILKSMGADIQIEEKHTGHAEPLANIHVKSSQLKGVTIPRELVSIAIDEFPCIMIAAAYANGITVLSNASELRVKESDRIDSISQGLSHIGIDVKTSEDGITVTGGTIKGGEVDSFGDHRIAMAFAVAAVASESTIRVRNCVNVGTSFPDFIDTAALVGLEIEVQQLNV
jgi:3-phosphoshikimate 1-carboxyvinyltransferase